MMLLRALRMLAESFFGSAGASLFAACIFTGLLLSLGYLSGRQLERHIRQQRKFVR